MDDYKNGFYVCAECGNKYARTMSDAEILAEHGLSADEYEIEEMELVCDYCYKMLGDEVLV